MYLSITLLTASESPLTYGMPTDDFFWQTICRLFWLCIFCSDTSKSMLGIHSWLKQWLHLKFPSVCPLELWQLFHICGVEYGRHLFFDGVWWCDSKFRQCMVRVSRFQVSVRVSRFQVSVRVSRFPSGSLVMRASIKGMEPSFLLYVIRELDVVGLINLVEMVK